MINTFVYLHVLANRIELRLRANNRVRFMSQIRRRFKMKKIFTDCTLSRNYVISAKSLLVTQIAHCTSCGGKKRAQSSEIYNEEER